MSRTRTLVGVLVIGAVVVLATRAIGWWAPLVIGIGIGLLAPSSLRRGAPGTAVNAVLAGWGALIAWPFVRGRGDAVVTLLGGVTGARGGVASGVTVVVALLTLALGAALAWAGATLGAWLRAVGDPKRRASATNGVTLSPTVEPPPARTPARAPAAQTP